MINTLIFVLALSGSGPAHAIDFDGGIDAQDILIRARAEAARDTFQPAGVAVAPVESKVIPVMADGGDGYDLRSGGVWRVIDRYDGKIFKDRLGALDGAFDVVSLASFQDRLLAVQKNGRVFVFCPTTGLRGVWAIIAVDMRSLEVKDSRLYAFDRAGRRYVYTGDLDGETDLGLRSSVVNGWLVPSVVLGNRIHNFKEVSVR